MTTMNLSRRLLLGGGLASAAAFTTGCGALKPSSNQSSSTAPGSAKATVADLPGPGDAVWKAWHDAAQAQFKKKHPDMKLEWKAELNTSETLEQLATKLAGGTLDTGVKIPMASAYLPIGRGQTADITESVNKLKGYADLVPHLKDPFMKDGKVMGFVGAGAPMGLIWNRKLFGAAGVKEAPTTMEKFREACAKASNPGKGIYGWATFNGIAAGWYFTMLAYAAGARIEVRDGDKWKTDLTGPEATKVLQMLKDMRWKDQSISPKFIASGKDAATDMAAGRLGSFFFTPDYVSIVPTEGKSAGMKFGDVGMSVIPQDGKGGAYYDAVCWVFNPKQTKEQVAIALQWAYDIVLDPENWDAQCAAKIEAGGAVAPLSPQEASLKQGSELRKQFTEITKKYANVPDDAFGGLNAVQPEGVPEPPVDSQSVYKILGPMVEAVLTNKNADVSAELGKAAQQIQKTILDKA